MRIRLLVVALLTVSTTAHAAPPINVPIFPPASDEPATGQLALAIQGRAAWLLLATGRYNHIHVKEIVHALESEDVPLARVDELPLAREAARQLGADVGKDGTPRLVTGRLRRSATGYTLTAAATGTAAPTTTTLPADLAIAIADGGRAMARLVADADQVTLPVDEPGARVGGKALASFHACASVLIRQPIGIENPTTLRALELDGALGACQEAVDLAPDLAEGWAALALALALAGKDQEAVKVLAKVPPPTRDGKQTYLPFYWVARFWLVTRYQSNEAGVSVLRDAIARHPGFLLAHGYLAELLNALHRHEDALVAWRAYQARAPRSPFVLTRIGYTLGKLGKSDEALASTFEARALAGQSRLVDLELGSRYIGGKKYDQAITTLEALAKRPNPRGEVLLRLGYAYLKKGDLDRAEALLQRALEVAKSPTEWRTRGRARYDIAVLHQRRKHDDQAQAILVEALREGFHPESLAADDKAMSDLIARAEAALSATKHPSLAVVQHRRAPTLSPFQIDRAGEIDPRRVKPEPPKSFELIRF